MYDQMYIFVELVQTCQTITLDVESWYTVDNVKAAIQNYEPIISEHYSIIFDGTKMDDLQTLADYKIDKGSTLLLEKHTLMHIHDRAITLLVERWYTTDNVKADIQNYEPIIPEHYSIIFDGTTLDDLQTLEDYKIGKGSTLLLEKHTLMHVYVELVENCQTIPLEVETWYTADDVKAEIQNYESIIPEHYCITYDGTKLDDHRTLVDYKIEKGSTLLLEKGTMQILVNLNESDVGSSFIIIHAASWDTIADVKAKIEKKAGALQDRHTLYFEQMRLEDSCTLADYDIKEDYTTLDLLENQQLQIFVKTLYDRTITLYVESSYTIGEVKSEIQKKGIPPNNYKLFFEGTVLEIWCSLSVYDIPDKSILDLVPIPKKKRKKDY